MTDQEQLRAANLWNRFRRAGLRGWPHVIDTVAKAEFFCMIGYDDVQLMVRYAKLIGAKID